MSIESIEKLKLHPRKKILDAIENENFDEVLLLAGQLHGHFCGGVALGVMASLYGLNEMKRRGIESEGAGLEQLLAIVETNSCFTDGVQFVTGCSLGNNGLVYRDFGKTAVTLVKRKNEKEILFALRISAKKGGSVMEEKFPDFAPLFQEVIVEGKRTPENMARFKKESQKISFAMMEESFDDFFDVTEVTPSIPDYAPIKESLVCYVCGESVMGSKIVKHNETLLCRDCNKGGYYQIDGTGGTWIDKA